MAPWRMAGSYQSQHNKRLAPRAQQAYALHLTLSVAFQGTCLRISLEDGCLLAEVAQRGVSMRRQDLDANLISPGFAQLLSLDRPVAVLVRRMQCKLA